MTPGVNLSTGTQLTTYTLALATTAEFTQAAGGKEATRGLLNQYVEGLNGLFGSELAIRFQLHPQNDRLLFENATTDGYSNGTNSRMLSENPVVINTALNGNATNEGGYDFGHVLGIGTDGGIAGTMLKASGVTNLRGPSFHEQSLSLLAHELGHQLGADHTHNGLRGSCGNQRHAGSAVEPGSGSTVMSYQGGCGTDDLDELPGDGHYFHAVSFHAIIERMTTANAARGTKTATGNTLPTIQAGPDRVIPANTPFQLTAVANDPDANDTLTYTWDQLDQSTAAVTLPISPTLDATGPLFRSFAPTTDPTRVFPRVEDLIANTPAAQLKGEHLPTQNRDLNFRVTVRDNHAFGGGIVSGVRSDDIKLSVVNTGAPFRVTALNNSGQTVAGGSQQTITWNVAGTTAQGINTSQVDIWLSVDGGHSFPVKLLAGTSNDGSATVTIPNVQAERARIKVQADAAQNIFFDITDANFRIEPNVTAAGGILVSESADSTKVAEGLFTQAGLAAIDTYSLALSAAPSGPVTITISADAQTAVSLDGANFAATQTVTFTPGDHGPRTISVRALDDALPEGVHLGRVRQAVTASADPNFNPQVLTGQVLPAVEVRISDDDAPPLIGVDLNFPAASQVPDRWNHINDPFQSTIANAIRENGDSTGIGFHLASPNATSAGLSSWTMDPTTIPSHVPALEPISDIMLWDNTSLTATWSGLRANARYRVYLFTTSDGTTEVNQTVSITGSGTGNPAPFQQNSTGKSTGSGDFKTLHLLVNDQVGSHTRPLEDYAKMVTSTADGKITLQITPAAGTPAIAAALAIQEFFTPAPGFTVTPTDGNTVVMESGTTDTFTVRLDAQPTSNVVLDITSGDPTEVTVNRATLVFTPANWNTPQTVTVTGVADGVTDGDQTVPVSVSVQSGQSDPAFQNLPAKALNVLVSDTNVTRVWQNPANRFDVSGDGNVVPLDVLRIFNELNDPQHRDTSGRLPSHRPDLQSYYDVNGDGYATPNDALQVINVINDRAAEAGEGEAGGEEELVAGSSETIVALPPSLTESDVQLLAWLLTTSPRSPGRDDAPRDAVFQQFARQGTRFLR